MTSPTAFPCKARRRRIGVKQRLLALSRRLRFFPEDRRANIAIGFAFMCIPVIGAVGVAIDYANAQATRTKMQTALDAAVLAGIAQAPSLQIDRARAVLSLNFVDPSVTLDSSFTPNPDGSFSGRVATDVATTVTALIGVDSLRVEARATASLPHERNSVCLLVLDPGRSPGLLINDGAELTAPDCEIHIRSTGNPALTMNAGVTLDVARLCVRGTNILNNGGPRPVETACSTVDDPYRGHLPTPPLDCTVSDPPPFSSAAVTLSPGTYCGNLIFNGAPEVTLLPGVYVIQGNMMLNTGSTLRGHEVSFYFPNSDATLRASGGVRIELSAPTSGAFAGLLMSEPPGLNRSDFVLNSSLGHMLEGLIYLPSRDVTFNAMSGATTDPTTMVVNSLVLNQGHWRLGGAANAMSTGSSRYGAYLID